jgi:twitching motility two-component system response regulator PilH
MPLDQSSASTPQKTVLVVEDSITQSESIRAVLEDSGLKVICAFDGPSGLKMAQQTCPDLVIMDVNMPGMDGFQVLDALKNDPKTVELPIVMLTSSSTPESVLTGLTSGAVDYIPKDVFAMRVLVETVRQMGLI